MNDMRGELFLLWLLSAGPSKGNNAGIATDAGEGQEVYACGVIFIVANESRNGQTCFKHADSCLSRGCSYEGALVKPKYGNGRDAQNVRM